MSLISLDKQLDYPYPFLVVSDNNNICQTWEKALTNNDNKNRYNKFKDEDKKNIQTVLKERTCQSVDGVKQCFTVNGQLETCNKLPDEHPKSIRQIMTQIDRKTEKKRNEMITPLEKLIEKKSVVMDNLIQHHATRQNMLEMNEGYHKLADKNTEYNIGKKAEIGDDIDASEDLKNNAEGQFKALRSSIYWYTDKNNVFVTIVKILLSIIIAIEFLYILSIKLDMPSNSIKNI